VPPLLSQAENPLSSLSTVKRKIDMNTATAIDRIESALINLESTLGEPAFDEWALVEKNTEGWKLMEYGGNRKSEFLAEFNTDMAALRNTLDPSNGQVGDFAFSHEGHGTGFDAHMSVGENIYLLLNNTKKNTSAITSNPKWTSAQIHFAELLEVFIADPVS
jgi:hypothetical protein